MCVCVCCGGARVEGKKGSARAALQTWLRQNTARGEIQKYEKWTEDDIHLICRFLEENKSYDEICDYFNIKEIKDRKRIKRVLPGR